MNEKVTISKVDENLIHVDADRGILMELSERFSFFADGYKFHPKVRAKVWDGKIRLFDSRSQTMPAGLFKELIDHCKENDYEPHFDYLEFSEEELSLAEGRAFVESVASRSTIEDFEVRDYQIETFVNCVRDRRNLSLSPTSSGKSWIIYLLAFYYRARHKYRTLVIVNSTGSVTQLPQDFIEYGENPENIHIIYAGKDKFSDAPIVISTWQSLQKVGADFFEQFDVIIGDEAHQYEAKSFINIMDKAPHVRYRFGFTGTIKDSKVNKLVLEGRFGRVRQIITTRELIDQGYAADIEIKCIVFQYDPKVKKEFRKRLEDKIKSNKTKKKNVAYDEEMDFLVSMEARNKFITNLAGSLKGNTLVFFNLVDRHGKILYNKIKEAFPDKEVFFVAGEVDGDIRNDIRAELEKKDNCIAVVSFGTFQTSISIKNIHNMIFASPFKGKIRNLQSIGRGLRKSKTKSKVELFDISDNLGIGSWKNYTIKHFAERIKTYASEKFDYNIYNVELKID